MLPKIINGGFETGTFEGWEIGPPQLNVPVVSTEQAHSGQFSAFLTNSTFIWQRFAPPIESRRGLILEYWLTSAGDPSHIVTVTLRRGGWSGPRGSVMSGAGILREDNKKWKRFVFPIPRSKSVWAIRFYCVAPVSMGIWLDDVCFRPLTSEW